MKEREEKRRGETRKKNNRRRKCINDMQQKIPDPIADHKVTYRALHNE